jgi:hypothetical protein
VVYSVFFQQPAGVYYTRSEDGGVNWSTPYQLDPDIPYGYGADWLQFALDSMEGLHVLWGYKDLLNGWETKAIRYVHSLDEGNTWSLPISVEEPGEDVDVYDSAIPGMFVDGQTVYTIWAGIRVIGDRDPLPQRRFRYSLDAGETWSTSQWMLDGLVGQALGDGLAVDSSGRLHFATQIRYPVGIWHAAWDGKQWSTPSLIYLIARNAEEHRAVQENHERIHAHSVRMVVRNGNQLVLTFTDSPTVSPRPLYATQRTLDDAAPVVALPLPVNTPADTEAPSGAATPDVPAVQDPPEAAPGVTESPPLQGAREVVEAPAAPSEGSVLLLSLVPVLLLVGGTVVLRTRGWGRS